MRDPFEPIEKVRMSDVLKVALLPGFRERALPAATAEGIGLAEFARRAIVERVRRLEAAGLPTAGQYPAAASAQPANPNTSAARAAVNPTAGAPASAAASTMRRDA